MNVETRDYYEVLGVSRDADTSAIKSAYRKAALRDHPDRNPGEKAAEERFKLAAEAYAVLSDSDKRARYDRYGHAGVNGGSAGFDPGTFTDFADILGDFFGFGFGGQPVRGRRTAGESLQVVLQLSFVEAAFGAEKEIPVRRLERCDACKGHGGRDGKVPATCSACRGQGRVQYRQGFFAVARTCPDCQGAGERIDDPCPSCRGEGRTAHDRTLTIAVPTGVDEGARLRLTGEGNAGRSGGPPGDLFVVLSVAAHEQFRREGADVVLAWTIPFATAVLGGSVKVPTLHGDEPLEVPAGTTAGRVFTLRGKGIPRLDGRGRGDQHVLVTIRVPRKLSAAQKDVVRKLAEAFKDEGSAPTKDERGFFEKIRHFLQD
jgi:molecular chaperone DnaJ